MNISSWTRISDSLYYYVGLGYRFVDLPWTTARMFVDATAPRGSKLYPHQEGGYLVASGEQSFLQWAVSRKIPRDAKAEALGAIGFFIGVTPCFRDEVTYDSLHKEYFMKSELFVPLLEDISDQQTAHLLNRVVYQAHNFFNKYLPASEQQLGTFSSDITSKTGIELGSYGMRYFDGLKYIYGTACAEPRLSFAIG